MKGKDLVNATGASKGSVSQWMNGGGAPSSRYISSLAKILKVNENWLLNGGELNTGDSLDLSLPPIKTVPLLSLQQAASWSDYMKKFLNNLLCAACRRKSGQYLCCCSRE
ncbi:helix-turn-helix domain-containing protein [Escherichia coli]|nr:helix-turn-helix domain-containing protein [Escherichia coli]